MAALLITGFNVSLFLFSFILRRNRSKLDDAEVKDRVGELYLGLKSKKSGVVNHASIFMLRRSIFIAITFALFHYPGIQI